MLKTSDSDSAVARTVSNMMLNNYKKGIAISNQEFNAENGIADSVGVVDPTESLRIKKQKSVPLTGPAVTKGYAVKSINASDVTRTAVTTGSSLAKEFIIQSKALDNELDHVVALMKFNNKGEFYNNDKLMTGGTLFTNKQKKHFKDNATELELNHKLNELLEVIAEKEENGHDTTDDYANFRFLESLMDDGSAYADKVRNLGHYKDLDNDADKDYAKQVLTRGDTKQKYGDSYNNEMASALKEMGYTIDAKRNNGKGKSHVLNNSTTEDLWNSYSGANSHLKSKNGIRVVNTVDVDNFSQELLLAIKKIPMHITTTLMPLAEKMFDTRFQGITMQDKNVVIPELYKDMDDKMYILTSLNNQYNTQLMKLDKEFDKLYNIVNNGLNSYVMPTGGSMVGGNIKNATDYLYEL